MKDLLTLILTNCWPFIGAIILIHTVGETITTIVAAFRRKEVRDVGG